MHTQMKIVCNSEYILCSMWALVCVGVSVYRRVRGIKDRLLSKLCA